MVVRSPNIYRYGPHEDCVKDFLTSGVNRSLNGQGWREELTGAFPKLKTRLNSQSRQRGRNEGS